MPRDDLPKQAGRLLGQALLACRSKRILIHAPRAFIWQWQIEFRANFKLNWPVYDGKELVWGPSQALRGRNERAVGSREWHREPTIILSSHLMRRRGRATECSKLRIRGIRLTRTKPTPPAGRVRVLTRNGI